MNFPILRSYFKESENPWRQFEIIQKEMDDVFDDLFGNWKSSHLVVNESNYPKVNVKEKEKEFEIIAATPGLSKKDIGIEYKKGTLTIRGESKQEFCKEDKYLCREIKKSSFIRSFKINEDFIDIDKISSKYEDGELRITIPKKTEEIKKQEIKKIEIL